jgi:hypothetical protein
MLPPRLTRVMIVAAILLGGVMTSRAQPGTPSPDPCEGINSYFNAYGDAVEDYWDWDGSDRFGAVFVDNTVRMRNPLTLSRAEWRELAVMAETAQEALRVIEPPPAFDEYHQIQIERMGLESAFAREALRRGVSAVDDAFADVRSELRDDQDAAEKRAVTMCPEIAPLFDLPKPVTTPTPKPPSSLMVTPIQPSTPSVGEAIATPRAIEATVAAYATREALQLAEIARLQALLGDVQVTATALAVVAANTVLDPTPQTITIQTDLEDMLAGEPEARGFARSDLGRELSRFPLGCRAGFMLISGKAPSVEGGVALAREVDELLHEGWPDMFDLSTGEAMFAYPGEKPDGEVSIEIFFYTGCEPIE